MTFETFIKWFKPGQLYLLHAPCTNTDGSRGLFWYLLQHVKNARPELYKHQILPVFNVLSSSHNPFNVDRTSLNLSFRKRSIRIVLRRDSLTFHFTDHQPDINKLCLTPTFTENSSGVFSATAEIKRVPLTDVPLYLTNATPYLEQVLKG